VTIRWSLAGIEQRLDYTLKELMLPEIDLKSNKFDLQFLASKQKAGEHCSIKRYRFRPAGTAPKP
jgi:hypothetical protein